MKKKHPKINGPLFREATISAEAIDEKARTVALAFSSEAPVSRWDWFEVLDHSPGAVRLDRLRAGGALLCDHNKEDQIGVIQSVEIDGDRKGRAVVRFSRSARAQEIFADVVDGIRKNVSVGYRVHEMKLETESDEGDTYRVTDWEPLEVSLVSIPADTSVGVGRSAPAEPSPAEAPVQPAPAITLTKETVMEKCPKCGRDLHDGVCRHCALEAERATVRTEESKRAVDIRAIGAKANCAELAEAAIRDGKSVDQFRAQVLEEVYKAKPADTPEIGLTPKEAKRFSIVRAIQAMLLKKPEHAAFELECSRAVATKMRKEPTGFFVPYDVTYVRDLTKGTATAGGYTVATDLLAASFIELLRNKMVVKALGARILGGLVGDIAIPRQTGGGTAYWIGENTDITAESNQTIGQVALVPKTVGAYTDMSRKLLMQSSIDVEAFVRTDLATVLALAIDLASIAGAGAAGAPQGIIYTTGIGSVAGGTNGAAPTWANIVALETEVANDNADVGALAYLTNSKVRGALKTTEKATNTAQFVYENGAAPGMGMLNGYPAHVSNQVPSDLVKGSNSTCSAIIFGNWSDLIIGEWGALDVLVDPYTGGLAGTNRIRVLQDVDAAVRHAQSFAAMLDALC
jgi:HK97 family phage major capsid protein/HK97 family phage prohead protease